MFTEQITKLPSSYQLIKMKRIKDGKPFLYGTTSHGEKECYEPDGLGFYANIDDNNVLNWIQNATNLTKYQLTNESIQHFDGTNDISMFC